MHEPAKKRSAGADKEKKCSVPISLSSFRAYVPRSSEQAPSHWGPNNGSNAKHLHENTLSTVKDTVKDTYELSELGTSLFHPRDRLSCIGFALI